MSVLADTGPLVAIISPADQHHELCTNTLRSLPAPLLSCWPVITEAAWLLRDNPRGFETLLESFQKGFVDLLSVSAAEVQGVLAIMRRYSSLRPQLADAMLVYLAGREKINTIFTLDRRDYSVYRSPNRAGFQLVPELK